MEAVLTVLVGMRLFFYGCHSSFTEEMLTILNQKLNKHTPAACCCCRFSYCELPGATNSITYQVPHISFHVLHAEVGGVCGVVRLSPPVYCS